jgi:hypothetical protein
MDSVELTQEELKHLNYLAQILDFGTSELQTKVKDGTHTHLQNFLLYSFVPVHNFTEAIYCLCKDSRPHAAQSLLRSVFEAYMNTKYVKNADTEKRLALFAKDSFMARKGFAIELENFVKRYPDLRDKSVLLGKESIKSLREFADTYVKAIEDGNNIKGKEAHPRHLIDKVKQLDKEASPEETGMYELNYHIMYRQLSLYTHLNSWGLEGFVAQGPESIIYTLGQDTGVDMIIGQVFLYYFDLLDDLYAHKVILGKMPEDYKKWFEELKMDTAKK